MPIAKELTIRLEDRPGTLGKLCQALAEQNVNILAYQQFPHEKGKGSVRLVVDQPDKAKTILNRQQSDYTETEVAQVRLAHRPGELARAASRLGDVGININYGYSGTEPNTNATLLIFGVAEVGKAVKILDQAAAAAATT
ncbi:MAG TPA: ACT domain-containing protein [Candidatus Dormibacteraeota bacterium]|nr:ACT domain-containing protein [Candidatus Dormibacteraeota bacterium]